MKPYNLLFGCVWDKQSCFYGTVSDCAQMCVCSRTHTIRDCYQRKKTKLCVCVMVVAIAKNRRDKKTTKQMEREAGQTHICLCVFEVKQKKK